MIRPSIPPLDPRAVPTDAKASKAEAREVDRAKDARIRAAELRNEAVQSDIGLKRRFFWAIVAFVCVWLLVVLAIVWCTGAGRLQLSDKVLLALLGTTSLNLIGLLYVIANNLFPKAGRK